MTKFYAIVDTSVDGCQTMLGYFRRRYNAEGYLEQDLEKIYPKSRYTHRETIVGIAYFLKKGRLDIFEGTVSIVECEFEDGF